MKIDREAKEEMEIALLEQESEVALPGNLQNRKEMANMFDRMVSPEYQEERRLENNRKGFVRKVITKVGL